MFDGLITSGYDVAELAVDAFTLFFIGLVFYLRREDRREGYPLEVDTSDEQENHGAVWLPEPKKFLLEDGRTIEAPSHKREGRTFAMERLSIWPGSPYEPTGNPLVDGVGPAAYAEREDVPDRGFGGHNKIVPMSNLDDFFVVASDPDPRGMAVIGADGNRAGTVSDLWVDHGEQLIRYLEVTLEAGGKVLLPMPFATVKGGQRQVKVRAILASQFEQVPQVKTPGEVTRREEDAICAYYAGGLLYATPQRAEPVL
ncbi:MAG: photosynthetic reaction center subunit H [Pseudomonadota bacterium]